MEFLKPHPATLGCVWFGELLLAGAGSPESPVLVLGRRYYLLTADCFFSAQTLVSKWQPI